ncbi:MAG TPA: sigma 54-interacting transcriptional regulator [Kofleriaceae bacterium]|nr:sigma 54-interacting transcriptional regulator [Kofleriaceae bacterium]
MSRWKDGPETIGKDMTPTTPVIALRNRETGEELAIGDGRYVMGKATTCDVVLADPCVSRLHCVLERRQGTLYVRDHGSRNGTFVNDRRVDSGELTPGTELMIGVTRFLAIGPRVTAERRGFDRLIGRDPGFVAAIDQARRVATTDVSVLVVGETGTGKELVAQAIHEMSRRTLNPFVAVNCGAFPRELIGSELFGHERGAFTGAIEGRDGVFVQADRGTLFLDELGELPLTQQPHLLRALETRRVKRIGGAFERAFDVRLVAATNNTNGLGTESGALRLDLYHRVATVLVQLPPLRARPGDIDLLCDDILDELAPLHGSRVLAGAARRMLRDYRWPGNVRELRQALTRGVALSSEVIGTEHLLQAPLRRSTPAEAHRLPQAYAPRLAAGTEPPPPAPVRHYDRVVRDAISDALEKHKSMRDAARALGMPKSTLADKVRRLGLTIPVRKPDRD